MRRGYYLAHELEAAVQRYLRQHKVPPSKQASVSSHLVYLNWKAAREKQRVAQRVAQPPDKKKISLPTKDVETPDERGAGEDVS